MRIEDFMPQTKPVDDLDRDYNVALEAAKTVEHDVGQMIVKAVDAMCDTARQKNIASALITALMIDKFEASKAVVGPEFRRAVEKIQTHIQPRVQATAQEHYDKNHTRWEKFVHQLQRLFDQHPVAAYLAVFGIIEALTDAAVIVAHAVN
jgi:hypothetical protein